MDVISRDHMCQYSSIDIMYVYAIGIGLLAAKKWFTEIDK